VSREAYKTEGRALLHLAWPIMGAQFLTMAMYFTDNVMVARLGEKPLAALAMAGTVHSTLYILSIGILSALSPSISHAYGARDPEAIGRWIRQGWRVALLIAAFDIFIAFQSQSILVFLGQDPENARLAQDFLRALSLGYPGLLLYFSGRTLCEATSDSRPSIYIVGFGVIANAVLDYLFIYGNFGFPALGVTGSGLATSFVNWALAVGMTAYVAKKPRYREFRVFERAPWFDKALISEFFKVGLPISGGMLAEMCFFAGATLTMGTLGSSRLAAHQIAINAASFTFMIPLGLAFAVAIRVGQFRGRGDGPGTVVAGRTGFLVTLLVQSLMGILFLFFPGAVTSLYTSDVSLAEPAKILLRIGGLFQIFDGLQVVGISALRGLKDTKIPFLNTVLSFWLLGAPLALWLKANLGPSGIWWGMVIGLGLAAFLHLRRFQRLSMKLIQ